MNTVHLSLFPSTISFTHTRTRTFTHRGSQGKHTMSGNTRRWNVLSGGGVEMERLEGQREPIPPTCGRRSACPPEAVCTQT